jgi:hypothetical protein
VKLLFDTVGGMERAGVWTNTGEHEISDVLEVWVWCRLECVGDLHATSWRKSTLEFECLQAQIIEVPK